MWTIRRATLSDRPALVVLCREAVGPDDYVPGLLGGFLATGVVFLAEDRNRAIGMMVYDDVPDGSVWLHAARTHRGYRRQGVATALMSRCETLARRRRRTAMRLWASADNRASVAANTAYGFQERARFTRMRIPAEARAPPALEPLRLGAEVRARLDRSPLLRRSGGYVFHHYYFLPVDDRNLRRLAREGALLRFGRNAISVSAGFEAGEGKDFQVQPLFGRLAAILGACPAIAASQGADRVESFLPHDPGVLGAARDAGFVPMEWGREAILFERRLRD